MGEREDRAKLLRERGQKLLSLDYFAMLGVARTASPDEVKTAFVEGVKTWHPDRTPEGLDAMRPLFAKVFARLDSARATLADPARRVKYIEELAQPKKAASASDLSSAEAELEFRKAEALFKKNDTAQAEHHLRRAVQISPSNVQYAALLVWIQAKPSDTPADTKKLVSELDRLIARDATCERAFFYRGQLRKRLELTKEAFSDFSKVAELNPSNIDAVREVRLYRMRQGDKPEREAPKDASPEGTEGVGGFFRKLFKR